MENINISWSKLRTHRECKQRSYLMRERKYPKSQDHRNFFAGTVTDRVVRDWLDHDPANNLGVMPSMVRDVLIREERLTEEQGAHVKWRDPEDKDRVTRECIEAVTKIEAALVEEVLPYSWVADYGFKVPYIVPDQAGGEINTTLVGYLDILVKESEDKYRIWDVKHTKDNGYWRKTAGQIAFYDLSMYAQFGGTTVRAGLLQPLCKEPVKVIPVDAEWRRVLAADITSMANDIVHNVTTPRSDSKLCAYCDMKHACVKFKTVNGKASLF